MVSKLTRALLAGGFTLAAAPVLAQTPPPPQTPAAGQAAASGQANAAVRTGATIYDTAGGVVGTVESVAGGSAVVSTGTTKVNLPLSSFGTGERGPTLALTRAQLEAEASQAAAASTQQLDTLLVAGGPVYGRNATAQLGTVKAQDPQFVTVTATSGADVRLPRSGFGVAQNRLIIGMTAEQFQAAVGSATAGASATGAATSTAPTTGSTAGAPSTTPATGTTGTQATGSTTATGSETGPATTTNTPATTTPPRG